jgi:hypothetical protein
LWVWACLSLIGLVSVSLSLPQSELALSLSLSGRLFDINTHLQRICRVYYLIGKHVLCVVLYIHIYIYIQCLPFRVGTYRPSELSELSEFSNIEKT